MKLYRITVIDTDSGKRVQTEITKESYLQLKESHGIDMIHETLRQSEIELDTEIQKEKNE